MHAPSTPVRPPSCSPPCQNRSRQRLRHNEPKPWSPTTFSSCSPPKTSPAFILKMVGHLQRKKVSSNTQVMTAVLRVQAPPRNNQSRPWAIRVASSSIGPRERPLAQEVSSSEQCAVPSGWATKKIIRGKSMKHGEWMRVSTLRHFVGLTCMPQALQSVHQVAVRRVKIDRGNVSVIMSPSHGLPRRSLTAVHQRLLRLSS